MREILFRGKRKDNGEWVYGDLVKCMTDNGECIGIKDTIYEVNTNRCNLTPNIVIPETIGQFTGLTDKNGKKIFEGDIVKSFEYDDTYIIRYFDDENYPAFDCVPDVPLCECNGLAFLVNTEGCEVIGNIHDNPELLMSECK